MYFLGINGSYRQNGLDEKMLNIVKKEFDFKGENFEIINLRELNIKRCEACLLDDLKLCTPERCFQLGDDFRMIADKMKKAAGIVFATPVHWYAPSAIMWNLIERMTSLENTRNKILQGKPVSVIAAAAEDGAQSAITNMIVPLIHAGMIVVPFGMTYYSGKEDDKETEAYLKRIVKNMIFLGSQNSLSSHDWW
jgi:multimeric flavodoxin WrbA